LEFAKSFPKPAKLALARFFLKENGSSETHLAGLKTGEFGPGRFSEALIQLREIRHPVGAKDISPQVLKRF
jgi:hypothetical protein